MALANRNNLSWLLPALFSLLFVTVNTRVWRGGEGVCFVLLAAASMAAFNLCLRWKDGKTEDRAAIFLLIAITVDYWVWFIYAQYRNISSYVILVGSEALRFYIVSGILRYFIGICKIHKIFLFYSIKYLFLDFIVCLLSAKSMHRSDVLTSISIFHPLLYLPIWFLLLFHLYAIAYYVVRFYKR